MSKEARKLEIITTKDGSHSIFVEHLNEQYHSIHGAYQEAMHVFIKNGLATVGITPVNVLEIGFGTGLNAWLSSIFAKQHQCQINYCGLELFPLDSEIINQLNFTQQLDNPEDQLLFKQIHKAEWEHKIAIHPFFELLKRNKSVHEYSEQAQYELIYFDAFGPKKQPDMWTTNVFGQLYNCLLYTSPSPRDRTRSRMPSSA